MEVPESAINIATLLGKAGAQQAAGQGSSPQLCKTIDLQLMVCLIKGSAGVKWVGWGKISKCRLLENSRPEINQCSLFSRRVLRMVIATVNYSKMYPNFPPYSFYLNRSYSTHFYDDLSMTMLNDKYSENFPSDKCQCSQSSIMHSIPDEKLEEIIDDFRNWRQICKLMLTF